MFRVGGKAGMNVQSYFSPNPARCECPSSGSGPQLGGVLLGSTGTASAAGSLAFFVLLVLRFALHGAASGRCVLASTRILRKRGGGR